jgi:3-isopropylmalate/(R)-2-methylmalate dehydratase large subunit
MHQIEAARFKKDVSAGTLYSFVEGASASPHLIRGKALIFWDAKVPGGRYARKLDAIDTDQITPAADCVSESLDTLDERWKAGAFRYLMPDFRERVHRGETFVIAGDRFAIGSSREMSPAGLKGVAEEAGRELVVICGSNMGDIFRRNALNLGLHVVQSPEAVADARDGDEFAFDPQTRRVTNVTQGTAYDPLPLTPKEDEIRRSGGIITIGRREFPSAVTRTISIGFPDAARARRMTTTEQIIWAHRVDKERQDLKPGDTLRVFADLLPASDGTAPFAIHTFNQITGDTIYPRQAAIANDHFVFTGRDDDDRQTAIGRAFARAQELSPPYYATPGDGIFHFYFPEQGLVMPGQFIPGADSHSRAYGAYGAVGIGVGSTTLGFGWSTGYVYFTLAKARRVVFSGRLQPWVSGKDIVLDLLRRWGTKQSQGMSVEFVDADQQLPIAYRNTIANMMAEAEALNGIFAADAVTRAWYAAKGVTGFPYPQISPGADAHYDIDEELPLGDVAPMIAKPFSPGNAFPADEVAHERLGFDKALIGSCTNGSYDDLLQAALVIYYARRSGATKAARPLVVFPGSGGVGRQIERADVRLGANRSPTSSVPSAGRSVSRGAVRVSGRVRTRCSLVSARSRRSIATGRTGWALAGKATWPAPRSSPRPALLGYMGPPSELGLKWDPETFGI